MRDDTAATPAPRIFLSKGDITELEVDYVTRAMRSGWVAPLGPEVDGFEADIAQRVGVAGALALSSGTSALHLALIHLGAGPGTLVLCPSMTFAATANAITYTGAEPIFVDSLPGDANVDPALMLAAADDLLDQGKKVVAAIPVDLYGRACDYDVLEPGLAERNIPLLEDAAEALGATYLGRAAGGFGRASALSFNGNKIMTTSGGGMLLSDDVDLLAHARKLSTQAREPFPWYEHQEVGYNFRLSNILAAIGRAQLTRLDSMIARRREIREAYREYLSDLDVRFLPDAATPRPDNSGDNAWLTSIIFNDASVDIDVVMAKLDKGGIEARHLWKPMHQQPIFRGSVAYLNGTSDRLFAHGMNLPSGSTMSDDDVARVSRGLHDALAGHDV